jgi:hypothetical protein
LSSHIGNLTHRVQFWEISQIPLKTKIFAIICHLLLSRFGTDSVATNRAAEIALFV